MSWQIMNNTRNSISSSVFGKLNDSDVYLYTLTNIHGNTIKITNYGGIITEWNSKDKQGHMTNIVVGFDHLDKYLPNGPYFGAIIGRFANRIAKGRFDLNGHNYTLSCNNDANHLHGGIKGFDKALWNATIEHTPHPSLLLSYYSKDEEEGYPGNLYVLVRYRFTDDDELEIVYTAKTDEATPINLTSHSYFNLTGDVTNDICDHYLTINAAHYTPVDNSAIPTGEIASVRGTPFDFTQVKKVGVDIDKTDGGYDHNYVLDEQTGTPMAVLTEQTSGRTLEVYTDQPGMQFYTGNYLDGTMTTNEGRPIKKRSALCLETQHFPDSPNIPSFPSSILQPGDTLSSYTIYKLSCIQ